MSNKKTASVFEKNGLICLRKGLYYDPVKDSYMFTSSNPEDFGPISIGLQLTRRCDANCIHCAASELVPDLPLDKFLQIIDNLHKGGCVRVSVTGGEPLVHKDIIPILQRIHKLGMAATLSTNGLALTEKKFNEMKPYLNNIRFSLHGLQETNDYIFQVPGAFKKIMKMIDLCNDNGVTPGVIFSVMRRNLNEMIDVARLLERKGVKKMMVYTLMAAGRAKKIFAKEFVHVSELNKQLDEINKLKKKENWGLEVTIVDWRVEGQCLLVDPQGVMFGYDLSQADNTLRLGNVLEEDVSSLWKKYPFRKNYIEYYRNH